MKGSQWYFKLRCFTFCCKTKSKMNIAIIWSKFCYTEFAFFGLARSTSYLHFLQNYLTNYDLICVKHPQIKRIQDTSNEWPRSSTKYNIILTKLWNHLIQNSWAELGKEHSLVLGICICLKYDFSKKEGNSEIVKIHWLLSKIFSKSIWSIFNPIHGEEVRKLWRDTGIKKNGSKSLERFMQSVLSD